MASKRLFKDHRYPEDIITEQQLKCEFCEKLLIDDELNGITFEQYIDNCMETNNGTLSFYRYDSCAI